jgi:hypothetical protein
VELKSCVIAQTGSPVEFPGLDDGRPVGSTDLIWAELSPVFLDAVRTCIAGQPPFLATLRDGLVSANGKDGVRVASLLSGAHFKRRCEQGIRGRRWVIGMVGTGGQPPSRHSICGLTGDSGKE